jgi:hypothetical protein
MARARTSIWSSALLVAGLAASSVVGGLAAPSVAWARAEVEVAYTREQAFSAALRYLRVDLAYEVTEKDPDAAYLLFSFTDPELARKTGRGSIEVVQRQRSVRVLVSLPDLPSYREELLKRGLLDKLRTEYGEPSGDPPPEKPPAKKPPPESDEPAPDAPKEDNSDR